VKIRGIASELNYPFEVKTKIKKKKPAIGVVCPEIVSSYYTNIINSIQCNLLENDYDTIFMVSNFSAKQEMQCIDFLINSDVKGIICITEISENSSKFKSLAELNDITFLLISTAGENGFCHRISIDDRQGAAMAVNHLVDLGHKYIAYIGDHLSAVRKNSYIETLKSNNIKVLDEYIVENDFRFEECGYFGMLKLLESDAVPTAIFAAYDNIAIGAMRAIYEAGYSIPKDFSVIGIDNINVSQYMYKKLSTVNEPTADLGEIAIRLILDKINDKNKTIQNVSLNPTLNIRETTSSPRIRNLS
jgi:LacI family transcriptional regulator